MAGVLGIYGLITAVIINGKMDAANYSAYSGYAHLGAGLTVGMSSLAAGLAIGIVGDAGVRANAQQPRLFVGMILILIFAEALGLYGLIVGLVVASTAEGKGHGEIREVKHASWLCRQAVHKPTKQMCCSQLICRLNKFNLILILIAFCYY
ncbi:unnamed protein product [Durusdinium trenchii]|uniref:V-type proton ATPase proteolipid subunit n=2 Tax=Durusdinium trenchii TaxID=1381693 RepID=A0ABP0NLU6_9DINO